VSPKLTPELQDEFEILFGPEPGARPGPNPVRAAWMNAQNDFEGREAPPAPVEFVEAALEDYILFGVGIPVFYRAEGRLLARFPGAPIDVNPDAYTAIYAPDQVISTMQVHKIKAGEKVAVVNPFVPFKYQKINAELS
jgi:hypothetical protein